MNDDELLAALAGAARRRAARGVAGDGKAPDASPSAAPATALAEGPLEEAPLEEAPLEEAPLEEAPLDEAFYARVLPQVEQARDRAARRPMPRPMPRPAVVRLLPWAAPALAAAAALLLLVARRGDERGNDVAPLPPYGLVRAHGADVRRGEGDDAIAPVRLVAGTQVEIVLRPARAPAVPPRVSLCVEHATGARVVPSTVEEGEAGSLRIEAPADSMLAAGPVRGLRVVLTPGELTETPATAAPTNVCNPSTSPAHAVVVPVAVAGAGIGAGAGTGGP